MKRSFRRSSVGLWFAPIVISSFGGCSSPPPPPKVVPKAPLVVAAPPPPPPLPPAHWTQTTGATLIGPEVEGGTLVLVGGRRMLLGADGSTKAETVPSPEPLQEVIVVHAAGGAKRFVARAMNGIYRLDDPLGAPKPVTRSENDIRAIGGYAGQVAVWTHGSDVPRFVDLETGKLKVITTLPQLPMRTVAFRNDKEGAAIFEGVGLAVTVDGGATWKRVSEEVAGDGLRVKGILVRDGALRAYVYEEGMDGPIDVAQARLGRAADPPETSSKHPLVRWIRRTSSDPLAVAASGGVEIGEGVALIASTGLLAKVDTKTGSILGLEEFTKETVGIPSTLLRAGKDAWLASPLADDPEAGVYEQFAIMRVHLEGESIKPERPALTRTGESELRTSPSGGVMLVGPCNADDANGDVCVRQPDGRWITTGTDVELYLRGPGPLGDGRVAFLRNLWDGDKPDAQRDDEEPEEEARPEEEAPEEGVDGREREVPEGKRLYIAAVGENHKEERIATLNWRPMGDVRIQSPIQEDSEHNLHFVVADDEGVYSVVQPMDKEARVPQRLEGITEARLRGSRGIAVGTDGLRATTDGGRTWTSLPLPARARETLASIDSFTSDPGLFAVSEVGLLLDRTIRIGWGDTASLEEPAEPMFDVTLPSISRPSPQERMLTCTVDAANVPGTPPLTAGSTVTTLLGKKTPAPKGTRRATSTVSSTRDGVMGTVLLFEEEGPDQPPIGPKKWTFNWHDPAEFGGKPRSWTGSPPKEVAWGAVPRTAYGSGARLLVTMRAGSKNLLVRTKGQGIETAEVSSDLLPSNDVVFGADKGEPIAWMRDNALIVWLAGEAPRVIGYVSYRSSRLLGEPTKDGVPVLLSSGDWSTMRVFPIPAADKKTAAPAALAPTLDGWIATPNLLSQTGRFPVCAAKPKTALRFSVPRNYARVLVDNGGGSLGSARYDVYVTGTDACVAQVSATVTPDRSPSRYAPAPATAPNAPKPKSPILFVRADFLGKRAEGGARGLPAKDAMHKLTCTLEERK